MFIEGIKNNLKCIQLARQAPPHAPQYLTSEYQAVLKACQTRLPLLMTSLTRLLMIFCKIMLFFTIKSLGIIIITTNKCLPFRLCSFRVFSAKSISLSFYSLLFVLLLLFFFKLICLLVIIAVFTANKFHSLYLSYSIICHFTMYQFTLKNKTKKKHIYVFIYQDGALL